MYTYQEVKRKLDDIGVAYEILKGPTIPNYFRFKTGIHAGTTIYVPQKEYVLYSTQESYDAIKNSETLKDKIQVINAAGKDKPSVKDSINSLAGTDTVILINKGNIVLHDKGENTSQPHEIRFYSDENFDLVFGLLTGAAPNEKPTKTTEWFVSGNPTTFRVVEAFRELGKIDWRQSTNVAEGDTVYVYVSNNVRAVRLKCRANKVNLKEAEIDDSKFSLSDDLYQGGRYMELEMLDEFDIPAFGCSELEKHAFQTPQSPVRVPAETKQYMDLIQNLLHTEDMEPDKHDASYEMMRETVQAYKNMADLSGCDYHDLNLVYLTSVGTWKQGWEAKHKMIQESNLPETEKTRLTSLLDNIHDKVNRGEYSNRADGVFHYGMFGTGFYTFLGKTDALSPGNFIQMCIDILDMEDDEDIFSRCEQTLNSSFRGMRAASASMVLHCIKPCVFPIFNSNMGHKNIFEYLGVDLVKKSEMETYISNCRAVKQYRDSNYSIKNYRIFDLAAHKLGRSVMHTDIDYRKPLEFLSAYHGEAYSKPDKEGLSEDDIALYTEIKEKGGAAVDEIKKAVSKLNKQFGFMQPGTISWLEASGQKVKEYLWAQLKYEGLSDNPVSISLTANHLIETGEVAYRVSLEVKNQASDADIMRKYHRHLDVPINTDSKLTYISWSKDNDIPEMLDMSADEIKAGVEDGIYNKVQLCRTIKMSDELTNDSYEDAIFEAVEELIPYYEYVTKSDQISYWPSEEEYLLNLTKDDWKRFIENIEYPEHKGCMRVLKCFVDIGGEASPKKMSVVYGGHPTLYTSSVYNTCKRAVKYFDLQPCPDKDTVRYFPIGFRGVHGTEESKGNYVYKMRDELMEALKEMDLSEFDITAGIQPSEEYGKNMILYGPPGTGKTYNTAIYAAAICNKEPLSVWQDKDYSEVIDAYRDLVKKGRITFTTFHQSYGYEEFIEGIKPVVISGQGASGDVSYKIEDGVFKAFCQEAAATPRVQRLKQIINDNPCVWKVSLEGSGENDTRKECFKETQGHIRIGWESYGASLENAGKYPDGGRIILNYFINEMNVGDIVISCYSQTQFDAIGVVTGDYEWRESYQKYRRCRKVEWILKDVKDSILEFNGGKQFSDPTVYRMGVSLATVEKMIERHDTAEKDAPYVFIIDEINRGNISKIFGELITLIEDTKRGGMDEAASAKLPYSGDLFSVPANVYVLGTMNTADRSIALMDTALRRRFQFIEMMPDTEVLRNHNIIVEDNGDTLDVASMLDAINKRIEFLYDREHTIGHAFFMGLEKDNSLEGLAEIFKKSVIPLLQEYFYEDYQKIQLVLGDNAKGDDEADIKFVKDSKVSLKNLFNGSVEDLVDEAEKIYEINPKALYRLESYKRIAPGL